jgi:hypothetical protein
MALGLSDRHSLTCLNIKLTLLLCLQGAGKVKLSPVLTAAELHPHSCGLELRQPAIHDNHTTIDCFLSSLSVSVLLDFCRVLARQSSRQC